MSPKKKEKSAKNKPAEDAVSAGPFETLGKTLDNLPEVQQAEASVQAAREELKKAQQACAHIRDQAAQNLGHLREKNVGDLIADTLHQVSKRPALGVGVSLLVGIIIGRITRR